MRINSRFLIKMATGASILSLLYLLTGCYDEVKYQTVNNLEEGKNLTILIPNIESAASYATSRADDNGLTTGEIYATENEAKLTSLWFCAYPQGNSDAQPIVENIKDKKISNSGNGYTEYAEYSVEGLELEQTYHIYLLANIEGYGIEISSDSQESDINSVILNFEDSSSSLNLNSNEKGLPMACFYNEIKTGPNSDPLESGSFTFNSTNSKLYADLTFLCTKVRYTILFNSTDSGISSSFGDDYVEFKGDGLKHSISNLRKYTHIDKSETLAQDYKTYLSNYTLPLEKYSYPVDSEGNLNDLYPIYEATSKTVEGDLTTNFTGNDNSKAAWQGVLYIPENLNESSSGQTTLTFNGKLIYSNGDDNISIYKDKKIVLEGRDKKGNKRGTFYDLRSLITNYQDPNLEFETFVKDWTLRSLAYTLHGPFDLTVSETDITVSSGVTTYLNYSTDSGTTVIPESPVFKDGEHEYDVFIITIDAEDENGKKTPGLISVRLNDRIPFTKTADDLAPYNYFHLNVGNLHKKIEVKFDQIGPYLNVNPTSYTINTKEYVSSGQTGTSEDGIPFSYNTNVSDLRLKIEKVDPSTYEVLEEGLLYEEQKINIGSFSQNLGSSNLTISNEISSILEDKLYLKISNIGSDSFWNSENAYKLTFTVYDTDGNQITGIENPQTIIITVMPNTDHYIIHFRDTKGEWNNPHIYIYQCLELPSDLKDENGNLLKQAGKTVGYSISDTYNAGREYAFTNGIAFRGWYGYGGPIINDPYAEGEFDSEFGTFWVFSKDNGHTYDATHDDGTRYYRDMDFNAEHIARASSETISHGWQCEECKKGNIPEWPGIVLEKEKENDGWWRYTLTGVATPGKALMMFSNGHNNVNKRYPIENKIGVPLFDYPDHEGWFLYDEDEDSFIHTDTKTRDDLKFVDNKPQIPTYENSYRIYWAKAFGKSVKFSSGDPDATPWTFEGTNNNINEIDDFYYVDFDEPTINNQIWYNYPLYDSEKWYQATNNLSDFNTIIESRKEGNVSHKLYGAILSPDLGRIIQGKPEKQTPPNRFVGNNYMLFKWKLDRSYCYYWADNFYDGQNGWTPYANNYPGPPASEKIEGYRFITFKFEFDVKNLHFILNNNDGDSGSSKWQQTLLPNGGGTNNGYSYDITYYNCGWWFATLNN